MKKLVLIIAILLAATSMAYAYDINWSKTAGPYTGNCVLYIPSQESVANRIFALGGNSGIFLSSNSGLSWERVSPMQANDLEIDPTDPEKVYMVSHAKAYYSSDGGETWGDIPDVSNPNFSSYDLTCIEVDPRNPNKIYVSSTWGKTIYRIDRSSSPASWHPMATFESMSSTGLLEIKPNNSFLFIFGNAPGGYHHLYRSTDECQSFTSQLFYGASNPTQLIALPSNIYELDGAWYLRISTNEGDSFVTYMSYPPFLKITSLGIKENEPEIRYAFLDGKMTVSTDGGATWKRAYSGLPEAGPVRIVVSPANSKEAYVSLGGDGIYKTTNGGDAWTRASEGFANNIVEDIAVDPDNQYVYAGIDQCGLWRSTNRGASWEKLTNGLFGASYLNVVEVDRDHSGHVYAGGAFGSIEEGVFKSTDSGGFFVPINEGLSTRNITDIVIDYTEEDETNVYLATRGNGVFWGNAGDPGVLSWNHLPNTGLEDTNVTCLALDSTIECHSIYAGTEGGGVFRYDLSGTSWETLDAASGTEGNDITGALSSLIVYPSDPNTIIAAETSTSVNRGIWVTTNKGSTWNKKWIGNVYSLFLDSSTAPFFTLYAGTYTGIYISSDDGDTWVKDSRYDNTVFGSNVYYIARDDSDFTYYASPAYNFVAKGIPDIQIPFPPNNFIGTAESPSSILWSWDNVSYEVGFKLYDDSAPADVIAVVGENVLNHLETGLEPNTMYTRKVTAFGTGESGYSDTYSEYTLANAPTDLRAASIAGHYITLNWNVNSNPNPADTDYIMEATTEVSGDFIPGLVITVEGQNPPQDFTGLMPQTTYRFRVYARNHNGITTEASNILTESTTHETLGPEIYNIRFDDIYLVDRDVVRPDPLITADLRDRATSPESPSDIVKDSIVIDFSESYKIYGPEIDSLVSQEGVWKLSHKLKTPLGAGEYLFKIIADDKLGNEGTSTPKTVRVLSGTVQMIGPTVVYPTPFSPLTAGGEATIAYTLSTDAYVAIYMYDVSGKIVWTRKFAPRANGGRTGYNEVRWNGITDFGGYAGNGIYVYKVVSQGKLVGTGKLVVYD